MAYSRVAGIDGRLVVFCETAAFRLSGFNVELFASEEIELSKRFQNSRAPQA